MRSPLSMGRVGQLRRRHGGAFVVRGRLRYDEPERTPYHHGRVEVFLDEGRRETHLGRGTSAADGSFSIPLQWIPTAAGRHLVVKVLQLRPAVRADEEPERCWHVVARARSGRLQGPAEVVLGDVLVAGHRYRQGTSLPRAHVDPEAPVEFLPEDDVRRAGERWRAVQAAVVSQPWEDGATDAVLRAVEVAAPAVDGLDGLLALGPGSGWTPDGEGAVLRLPAIEEGRVPGCVLPAVEVRVASGRAVSASWRATRRGDVLEGLAHIGEAGWTEVSEVVAARVRLELLVHELWGRVHLGLERHAVAALRHLRASPLHGLLVPHVRDVSTLNALAESAVFGDARVLRGLLPLDQDGLAHRLGLAAAGDRWDAGWAPRWDGDPRAAAHAAARDVVHAYVVRALARDRATLEGTWVEVMRLADELQQRGGQTTEQLGEAEPRFALRSRPEDHDFASVADWATAVVVRATFEQAWLRQRLLPLLAGPRDGLSVGWGEAALVLRTSPRELARRRALAAVLSPVTDNAMVREPLGIDPSLIEALASADLGVDPDRMPGRIVV